MYYISRRFIIVTFTGLFIVYIIGLFLPDLMEVDAAQYASISMEMAQTNSFLKVYHLTDNYLDKPPLLFWLGALFIKLFGINHFAYRLPNFIGSLFGIFATYALGKRLYSKNVGILSAIFLASSQVYILHNHDVRTDTLLTNFVIIAIWQAVTYLQTQKTLHFVLTFVCIGLAMLAKGPIGAVVPVAAVSTQLIYQRDWKYLFNTRWLVGGIITLLVLTPMLWGLYWQFDAHPLTSVNGRTGVSGIRFYFWEQSFGRITGENTWKNDSSFFFFIHNYLWEFLPWSVLGIGALMWKVKGLISNSLRFDPANEMLTVGGFVLPFIALSTSHYKLPHYILVIMPLASIFTAAFVDYMLRADTHRMRKTFSVIQFVLAILIGFFVLFILYFVFPANHALWWAVPMIMFPLIIFWFTKPVHIIRLLAPSLVAVIFANFVMGAYFYPQLNRYQAGTQVAYWINQNNIPHKNVVFYKKHYHNIYFYTGDFTYQWVGVKYIKDRAAQHFGSFYVLTNQQGLKDLKENGIIYQIEKQFFNFPNAELTPQFLNPKTREQQLEPIYVVIIESA